MIEWMELATSKLLSDQAYVKIHKYLIDLGFSQFDVSLYIKNRGYHCSLSEPRFNCRVGKVYRSV